MCYPILDSSLAVNEDRVVDRVGVMQPTSTIIHDECVWEFKEEPAVKDDSLPAVPHSLYPDNPCDSATADFPRENPFPYVSTSDHSSDTLDVSLSLQCREDTCSSKIIQSIIYLS